MRHRPLANRTARARSGFTLVELLVALVLIDAGLLAIVGAGAVVVKRTSELRARTVAVRTASNRLELLGARSPCTSGSGSDMPASGMVEDWSVAVDTSRVRELTDSVAYETPVGPHSIVLRTRLPC